MVSDGNLTYFGGHFVMYPNVGSLGYTPKTNIILHVNCTSIKINEVKKKKHSKAKQ